ncbi:MAG: cation diffusion facilitator family transporter [Bacteroidales bacterium]|nr:cation diffusion facilitator family transporter [Bacteroidales bacterium]
MPRQRKIIFASWVAIFGNLVLAILKIVIGIISGSLAVVADGIDSASDIATSFITLVTARLLAKPPNIKFPYGYEKADTMATKVLSFVIFFAGIQLAMSTTRGIIANEISEIPGKLAIIVTVVSIFGKLFLATYLKSSGKKVNSSMLEANGKNMQNDVLISVSVLLGLIFIYVFKLPVLDRIIALAVSAWIMLAGIKMFLKTNTELMDGMKDPILYCELFNAVNKVEGAHNPHRVRVRKLGSFHMISMDLEVEPLMTVKDAHDVAKKVEDEIKATLPNVYDIVVHIEPIGNQEQGEKFGLREGDVKGMGG